MASFLTITSLLISFILVLILVPGWIRSAGKFRLTGRDVHKRDRRSVAEAGGVIVILGALVGMFYYIGIKTFVQHSNGFMIYLLAAVCSILIALLLGLVDDLLEWRKGLRQWQKIALSILIPIPLMVVNSGHHVMNIPFLGSVDFGILYSLVIVPIGIVGASNGFNMLAGHNGLEAGMGALILSTLGLIAWLSGNGWAAVIALCIAASLIAFLVFNFHPSSIFPGDSMTYPVGASIAIVAILADIEKFAVILFIPYFIEFLLKSRGRFVHDWTLEVLKDNSLKNKYRRWYSLPHAAAYIIRKAKKKAFEHEIVLSIWAFQGVFAAFAIAYYFMA